MVLPLKSENISSEIIQKVTPKIADLRKMHTIEESQNRRKQRNDINIKPEAA